MVEFLRDVVIVVAILMTLIAVALHPTPEADAARINDRVAPQATAPAMTRPAGSEAPAPASVPHGARP